MENIISEYPTPEDMATDLTTLMDEIDRLNITTDSATSQDETMMRIYVLANYLSWFRPELLDSRFN